VDDVFVELWKDESWRVVFVCQQNERGGEITMHAATLTSTLINAFSVSSVVDAVHGTVAIDSPVLERRGHVRGSVDCDDDDDSGWIVARDGDGGDTYLSARRL
jgi:hypothetical protein